LSIFLVLPETAERFFAAAVPWRREASCAFTTSQKRCSLTSVPKTASERSSVPTFSRFMLKTSIVAIAPLLRWS